ncbi:MAG: DUF1667 domain-containing protein [Victivallales bacterium]|nr:DUF1667 domain-containing protein [Victivallales bacterium]
MKKEITCIGCPMGCQITAILEDDRIVELAGYTCPRGEIYARKECTTPERTITTLMVVPGVTMPVCVKTAGSVPKARIAECLKAIHATVPALPVKEGQVLLANVCGTGVDVVATRSVSQ